MHQFYKFALYDSFTDLYDINRYMYIKSFICIDFLTNMFTKFKMVRNKKCIYRAFPVGFKGKQAYS